MTEVETTKTLEEDLKEKVGVGAQYVSSFLGSAWSKASEGAAFFSFATGPDDEEEETLDPKDLPEENKEEDSISNDKEEEDDYDPLSTFLTAAMCKVGFTKSASSDEMKESESSYSLVDSAYSVFEKAKKTLEENIYSNEHSMFEMNKEQDAIVKQNLETQRLRNYYKGMFPWLGYENESELKDKIMALSSDKRNFLFDPPAGVTFDFDCSQATGIAEGLLAQDENLQLMRYRIVPKLKNEESFWKNYFYRVSLIQQCYELKSVQEYVVTDQEHIPKTGKHIEATETPIDDPSGDEEFVSDSFQTSSKDMDEATENVKKLSKVSPEDEIEAELENELQEYEVVKEEDNTEWENQLEDMLDSKK
uniref:Synapse-associated protein 1 n=1 Tax=Lepeophtheirus salmonis TaxID=72036 RepID=D3PIM2_LEPSM|nr:Synapse-associated protein 1 [Lepeophtheirus salmonis]